MKSSISSLKSMLFRRYDSQHNKEQQQEAAENNIRNIALHEHNQEQRHEVIDYTQESAKIAE